MNSIADVLALTPGPSWHECVALVQEIAANLQPDQPLPQAQDLLLEADGSITFGFAGESARSQVADLSALLSSLLQKADAPHGLRDLATENAVDQPAHATIASFARALAFYERPNRRGDLQALAGRLEGRSHAAQAERTLAELRERVARKSEEQAKQDVPAAVADDRSRKIARARAMAIAAAVVLAAAGVSAMTVMSGWNRNKTPETVEAAAVPSATVDETGGRATDAVPASAPATSTGGRSTGHKSVGTGRTLRETPPSAPHGGAHARPATRPSSGFDTTGIKTVGPLADARPAHVAAPTPRAADIFAVAPEPPLSDAERVAAVLYTSANTDVTPPAWTRRQLPSQPAPDSQTGYFDIVIDTQGDVESVQLVSPTKRYEERMLMAAAKAWKFHPAMLNGQPVRYQMRVPITLTWTVDR